MTALGGSDLIIRDAEGAADMETVRELFIEFQAAIDVDLCFQGFEEEVAMLPGRYVRPFGRLLLALDVGYKSLYLHTLEFMTGARVLNGSMGFVEIPAYDDNPLDGGLYMEHTL